MHIFPGGSYHWFSLCQKAEIKDHIQEFSGVVPLANSWSGEFLRQSPETANRLLDSLAAH